MFIIKANKEWASISFFICSRLWKARGFPLFSALIDDMRAHKTQLDRVHKTQLDRACTANISSVSLIVASSCLHLEPALFRSGSIDEN